MLRCRILKRGTMQPDPIREYARAGALLTARQIISEFPDILSELNAAANGHAEPVQPVEKRRYARRPFTESRRAKQSAAMKASWKRRKAEAGK